MFANSVYSTTPTWAEVVAEVKAEREAKAAERALPAHEDGQDAAGTADACQGKPEGQDRDVTDLEDDAGHNPAEDDALVEALDKDKNSQHGT